jgi:methyl-accepting chemotaxis protein
MNRIRDATQQVQSITVFLDAISMQTHILGLNASIEASNAGHRGRGFGVVAASVRDLAKQCQESAADVRRLVGEAAMQAEAGMDLAKQAGDGLRDLISNAQDVSQNIALISRATLEQRDAIGVIDGSMSEIDGATQQNASVVEEAAAAAVRLKQQADRLTASIAAFKLD